MKRNRILFVCHGNICRSVMGQYMLQDMVEKRGIADRFIIESAACRNDELGSPIYPPARKKLQSVGVPIGTHRARKIRKDDASQWDLIVGMDDENMRDMKRLFGPNPPADVVMAMHLVGEDREVADPWYTGNFQATYDDLSRVCTALLERYEQQ